MKKVLSLLLVMIMLVSSAAAVPFGADGATKAYAENKLAEIQQNTKGFINGQKAVVTGNCYLFVSKVCEKLYGVKYDGEGLYGNFRSHHYSGNYYTVNTYTTQSTYPNSTVVEGIISFFLKNAAPGDIIHYGAYTTGTSNGNTHTVMINSIDKEKMSVYHANYQTTDYSRASCHIDYIYWDSLRKNPTSNEKKNGKIYSMNSIFYNKMKSSGLGITINRASNYTDLYYLVGAAIPALNVANSSSYNVKASWDKIIDASQYQVDVKKPGEKSFTTLSSTYKGLSYELKDLKPGDSYTFKVRACIGGKWYDWSDEKSIKVAPAPITYVKFNNLSDGVEINWTERDDISGVNIYRGESANNLKYYKDVNKASASTYTDKDIEYGKTYYYVFERYLDYKGKAYTTKSAVKSFTYKLPAPKVTYEHLSTTSVKVKLAKNGVCDSFVYYLTDSSGKKIVGETNTKDTSVTFKGLNKGEKYNFFAAQKTKTGTGTYGKTTFQLIPAIVKNVRVWVVNKGLKVTFNKQSDAEGYLVYRSTSKNGKYTKIATLGKNTNYYFDTSVKYNKAYYYKVYSAASKGTTKYYSWASAAVYGRNYVATPTGVKASRTVPTAIKVSWKKAANAQKYVIQYKTSKNGKWKIAGSTGATSTNRTFSMLKIGTTYYFRVKASNAVGSSKYSSTVKKSSGVPTPAKPAAHHSYNGISLNWQPKSYATGYRIYRATSKNGTYKLVKTVKNNKTSWWTDTSITAGKNYYYKIDAYKKSGKTIYSSAKTGYVYKKYQLSVPAVKFEETEDSVTLRWNYVEGANRYIVEWSIDGGKYFSTTVKGYQKYFDNIKQGTKVSFRVKAASDKGTSAYSTVKTVQF